MDIFLRQCRMEDIDKLRALSMQTFYETFAALNTRGKYGCIPEPCI